MRIQNKHTMGYPISLLDTRYWRDKKKRQNKKSLGSGWYKSWYSDFLPTEPALYGMYVDDTTHISFHRMRIVRLLPTWFIYLKWDPFFFSFPFLIQGLQTSSVSRMVISNRECPPPSPSVLANNERQGFSLSWSLMSARLDCVFLVCGETCPPKEIHYVV